MKYFRDILFLILLCSFATEADAFTHGRPTNAGGISQINIGQGDQTDQSNINLFNTAQVHFSGGATPAALDAEGYPVQNFSGSFTGQLGPVSQQIATTGPWTFAWDAGRSCFGISFSPGATATNVPSGVTITPNGQFTIGIAGPCNGVAGSLTLNWANDGGIAYSFLGTYTQWASNTGGGLYLYRNSDAAAFASGIYWTPEMVAARKNLGVHAVRPMGWNILGHAIGTNVVNWSTRKTVQNFSWFSDDYPPSIRCGGTTSFCTISVSGGAFTSAAASGTPLSGWQNGEQISGNVASSVPNLTISAVASNGGNCQLTVSDSTNLSSGQSVAVFGIGGSGGGQTITACNTQLTTIASVDSVGTPGQITLNQAGGSGTYTSGGIIGFQTLTITGKSGGAKLILATNAFPTTISSGFATFTYNAVLDKVLYNAGGVSNGPPIEAQVQLANLTGANYWYNFPTFADDNYAINAASTVCSNISNYLHADFEYSNEVWNFGQDAAQWSYQMGVALGLAGINSSSATYFESLRIRQIFGNDIPASTCTGMMSRVERKYCIQSGYGGTAFATGPMTGSNLISPGTTAYQNYVGGSSVNYNTFPNRPIDFTETVCYAPYVAGGTGFSGQSPDTHVPPTGADATNLQTIATDMDNGDTTDAIALVDQYIRGDLLTQVQTATASGTTFTTPNAHGFVVNDIVRFTVAGGTTYSNLNLQIPYQILSTPTSQTFTAGPISQGATGSAVNAGTAGSGTTSVGELCPGAPNPPYCSLNIFGIISTAFTKYQNMAVASPLTPRPTGMAALKVDWYEGNLVPTAPTTAQCTAISISSGDCTQLANALTAWKNSLLAAATVRYYYGAFTGIYPNVVTSGAMPNSGSPSWLVLQGWRLRPEFKF